MIKFKELNTVDGFKDFLTEYHKKLHKDLSFPPLKTSKALDSALALFDSNSLNESPTTNKTNCIEPLSVNGKILVIDDDEQIHIDYESTFFEYTNTNEKQSKLIVLMNELFEENSLEEDNNPVIRFILDSAFSGDEGYEKIIKSFKNNSPYSLVIIDGRMPPGMSGISTIKKVWKKHPNVNFILCSAYVDYSLKEIHNEIGISDRFFLIHKPFNIDSLRQLVLSLAIRFKNENKK